MLPAPKIKSAIKLGLILLLLALAVFAQDNKAEKKDALQTGTVQAVVKHAEGRMFDIVWPLTPIYDDYPYFDITVGTPDHTYVVRYESMGGYYPRAWETGKEVQFRREKGRLLLLRYDGELVPARIMGTLR